jgi:hypothetical protein
VGSWSDFTIGEIVFAWKHHVPTFLAFVFAPDDLFIEREQVVVDPEDEDDGVEVNPDELYIEKGGYRTTVVRAKAVLDEHGYTVPFFAEIYESFRGELDAQVRDRLADELGERATDVDEEQLKARIEAHASAPPNTAIGDLEAFTAFLREAIETDLKMEPFLEDLVYDMGPDQPPRRVPVAQHLRYRRSDLADFETLHMLILDRAQRVPANVLRPMMLFDEGYIFHYPEVASLLYTRLVLDAMPDVALVELDVHQVVETEAEIRSMHTGLAYELLHKVDVYERVFRALSAREEDVQDRYARTQVRNALSELGAATGAQGKGEALEALMAAAFSIKSQLQVVQRRYSTGDEEIDLVVKNNVGRPFWTGLGSSLLFVECKNWTAPVGAPEIRNFEGKLANHAPLARIGILVAPGGFTSEAINATKRSSRDAYTIILADREDLDALAHGGETVLEWIERLLCAPI